MDKDFYFEVSRGSYKGFVAEHKFGHNEVVGTSWETLWNEGGLYAYPGSATTMTISSDDVNDTSAGTGARTVEIFGLDSDYTEISETVTLNGTSGVTTVNSYLRNFRMQVVTAGSGVQNAGIIYMGTGTITAGKPANVYALIDAELNQTLMSIWTVPAGVTAYIPEVYFSVGQGKELTGGLFARPENEVFQVKYVQHVFEMPEDKQFSIPLVFEEKTDIELRGKVDATTSAVAGGFEIVTVEHGTSANW